MALLISVDSSTFRGAEITKAIQQIRDGLAVFDKYDGLRAQTIGVSAAKFGEVFGIADPTEAQALSDRWASIVAGNYSGFTDFIDTVYWP
ncbi:MAG: hypothetical protein IPK48_07750 [Gammaproteobacteria bacterium]|nr:hypothetical protein [Gammaproteobacteria bacterium]